MTVNIDPPPRDGRTLAQKIRDGGGQHLAAGAVLPPRQAQPPQPPPPAGGMTGDRRIRGYCPWGCGESLFIAAGGFITCSKVDCPRPTGLSDILADPETQHIVQLKAKGFAVKHPLRERVHGALFRCELITSDAASAARAAGHPLGRYRVTRLGDTWQWEQVPQI